MSNIQIRKISITELDTDAIVNAANEGLMAGGGVCGIRLSDEKRHDISNWRGTNILGFALMVVREKIRSSNKNS